MELVKNIFFNTDKLTAFSQIKISYSGKFFSDGSKKVTLHYGFGNNWENSFDIEMVKSELGFQAEVSLTDDPTFNFCFYNENGIWDNNNGENYNFTIEPAELDLIPIDNEFSSISPKRITKFYLWKKKVKIRFYRVVTYLPKIISGKYKRKINNDE